MYPIGSQESKNMIRNEVAGDALNWAEIAQGKFGSSSVELSGLLNSV